MDARLRNEITHGSFLIKNGAGEIWNWCTPAGILRWKRRVQLLCNEISPTDLVMELGCGTGFFTKELTKVNANTISIDIASSLVQEAKKTTRSNYIIGNAYQAPLKSNSFDKIIGSSVLHHLDMDKALQEISRLLKPGGKAYFTEPNMFNPQILIQKNIPMIKKILGDSPDETAIILPSFLKLLKKHHFKEINITPFDFLHPKLPKFSLPFFIPFTNWIEKTPLLRYLAGSYYIRFTK